MTGFTYFAVLAEMRTGSNLLESHLNALDGVTCHGELFNPVFVGGPKRDSAFGISLRERDQAPEKLLRRMLRKTEGMPGFRLFHDHDPRIIDHVIKDPTCAKIVLTRNPVDAYISRLIAGATNQWRLGDAGDRLTAPVTFDATDFQTYLSQRQTFQQDLRHRLQASGQTAFWLTYEDLRRLATINGLATFLGVDARLQALPTGPKKQNPEALTDKVSNAQAMRTALAGLDWLDLDAAPLLEPERGPAVPSFIAAAQSPMLFQPIAGGPTGVVQEWLVALDGAQPQTGFTQKTLRAWLDANPARKTFTVVSHPLVRAFRAFRAHMVDANWGHGRLQSAVARRMDCADRPDFEDPKILSTAFTQFLNIAGEVLTGQSALHVMPDIATQSAVVEGFARFVPPDLVLREDDLASALNALAPTHTDANIAADPVHAQLTAIHSPELDKAARRTYRRDYTIFGFEDWRLGGL